MIKTAGANVSPREVEAAILERDRARRPRRRASTTRRAARWWRRAVRVPADRAVDVDDLRDRLARAALGLQGAAPVPASLADDAVPMLSSGKLDLRALEELLGERLTR